MSKSKWHNISIKQQSFEELQRIQKAIPLRASLSQTVDWLISVGQNEIKKSGVLLNGQTGTISK